jgi:retron-type reverse transcriptase
VEDKIAQNAVNYLLLTIYEQEFLPMSFGFRPGKNAHQLVEGVKAAIAQGKVSWVLYADIQSFFDSMSH